MSSTLVEVRDVVKDFRSLRPLRVQLLEVREHQSVALLGFDQAMAEVLVNLVTGAILPDTGAITVFGQLTSEIVDPQSWVRTLDQFGLISERAVMLDHLTAEQNLALPLSLQVHSMPEDVRQQVGAIAGEVGLGTDELRAPLGTLPPLGRQRVRLGRALALNPKVLLAEHPNAPLSPDETRAFGRSLAQVIESRRLAAVVLTANAEFAAAISSDVLSLQPATGLLKPQPAWRRWFS